MRPMNIVRGRRSQSPAYSTLQKIISQVVGDEQEHMAAHLERAMSRGLKQALAELVNGTGPLPFRQLRQSARNFTGTELEKELIVYRHIQHWMPEVDLLLSTLSLSQKNLQHGRESRLLRCQTETSNRRQPMAVFIVLSSNAMAASAGTYCRWLCASCQTDQTEGKGLCAGSGV
jgi:hypothetical protein